MRKVLRNFWPWYSLIFVPPIYAAIAVVVVASIPASEADTARRIYPDIPSAGVYRAQPEQAPASPCATRPWEPGNAYHARDTYRAALAKLTAAPQDVACRQQALYFGRLYSAFTRRDGRVTLYDETAIANDINAATGSAAPK